MEVDGVLGGQEHVVQMRKAGRGHTIACPAALRPLIGKVLVAWRLIRPSTLVLTVKSAPAARHASPVTARSGTSSSSSSSEEEQREEEEAEADSWQPPPLVHPQQQGPAPRRVPAPRTACKRRATRFRLEDEASMPARRRPHMQVDRGVREGGGAVSACKVLSCVPGRPGGVRTCRWVREGVRGGGGAESACKALSCVLGQPGNTHACKWVGGGWGWGWGGVLTSVVYR